MSCQIEKGESLWAWSEWKASAQQSGDLLQCFRSTLTSSLLLLQTALYFEIKVLKFLRSSKSIISDYRFLLCRKLLSETFTLANKKD